MKKTPLKWKLFLIFAYVQLVFWGVIGVSVFYSYYQSHRLSEQRIPSRDIFYLALIAGSLLEVMLHNFLNIYAVHRFFPSSPIPAKLRVVIRITGIITSVLWIGLLILSISGIKESSDDEIGKVIAFVLLFIWMLGLYNLIMELGIFRFLNRNDQQNIDTLIGSIGNQ